MKDFINYIDTETDGSRYDVTPIFENIEVFNEVIESLVSSIKVDFDKVAGIDALGFILGTGIALKMNKGFIPLRKGGKLPCEADSVDFIDYTGNKKNLEMRKEIIEKGTRVLLVDEWIETGAQIDASIKLIERQGGTVVGIASIAIDDKDQCRRIRAQYPCYTLDLSFEP
jgi:adenine phosphoribosyltransferase